MTIIGEAFIALRPSSQGFEREADQQVSGPLRKIASAAAGIAIGAGIGKILKGGIAELSEAQRTLAQTNAVIRSTGGVAGVTSKQVEQLADSLSKLTGVDDENIVAGQNLILTFKSVRNEAGEGNDVFDRATKAALDLSVAFSQDLSASSIQLGKALDNPVLGVTALRRVGISFTQSQIAMIKQLVATNKTLDAQKIILEEVESQVKGSAEAFGETLPGKVQKMTNSLDAAKEQLIVAFAPAMERGVDVVSFLAREFETLPDGVQTAAGGLLLFTGAVVGVARPINEVLQLVSRMRPAKIASAVAESAETIAVQQNTRARQLNSAAAVENLYATQRGRGALLALGVGGAVAAAGVAGLSFVMGKQSKFTAEAQRTTEAYTAAIREQTGALDENIDAVTRTELGTGKAARILREAGANVDVFIAAVRDGDPALEGLVRLAQEGSVGVQGLADAGENANLPMTALSGTLLAMYQQGKLSGDQFLTIVTTLQRLRGGLLDGKVAAEDLDFALGETGGATDAAAEDVDELAAKLDELIDNQLTGFKRALDELLNKPLAEGEALDRISSDVAALARRFENATDAVTAASERVGDAERGVSDAAGRLDELLATPSADRGDDFDKRVAEARQDLADANAALAEANDKLAESQTHVNTTLEGNSEEAIANRDAMRGLLDDSTDLIGVWAEQGIKGDALREKIGALSTSLVDQAEALGIPREQAEQYFGALDKIPPSVTTILEADPSQAQAQIDAVMRMLDLLKGAGDFSIEARVTGSRVEPVALAAGGIGRARPGRGISATIAEGGYDEAVIPLPPGLLDGLMAIGSLARTGGLGGGKLAENVTLVTPDPVMSAIVLSRGLAGLAHRLNR